MDETTKKIIKEVGIDCLIIWGIMVLWFAIYEILSVLFASM